MYQIEHGVGASPPPPFEMPWGTLIKISLRGMVVGIFLPIAMLFNSYLSTDLKINFFFSVPDWYPYVHLALFFPIIGMLTMNTSPPLTTDEMVTLCSAIIANGFLYAIVFALIKKMSFLFQQLIKGDV